MGTERWHIRFSDGTDTWRRGVLEVSKDEESAKDLAKSTGVVGGADLLKEEQATDCGEGG
jgi:hypothetical protein